MKTLAALLLAASLSACASDGVDAPEPTLSTPGSFVAQEEAPERVRLLRLIGSLLLENGQTMLIFRAYEPRTSSFEAAKDLAKEQYVPSAGLTSSVESEFRATNWKVVWYRTLRADERL